MSELRQSSVYLNDVDQRMVKELMELHKISKSGVVRLGIQMLYRASGESQSRLLEIADEVREIALTLDS